MLVFIFICRCNSQKKQQGLNWIQSFKPPSSFEWRCHRNTWNY